MVIKNKKIAIIGGGPGGLTLARLLQQKGADVTVHERDAGRFVRVQGATLDLHDDSGLKALNEAGLIEEFKKYYRPGADKTRITDKYRNILYDQHEEHEEAVGFGHEHFRPEIDRGPLRDLLLDSLQPETVVWDSHITSLEKEEGKWQLVFQNGRKETADLVIGADGANSKIRPYLTPIKPFYSGITVVEGSIYNAAEKAPSIYELVKEGKVFAFGDQKSLIVSAKGDGSLSFYTGCRAEESWMHDSGIDFKDNKSVAAWFRTEFSDWDEIWQELFATEGTSFAPRPQYCMPLDQTWEACADMTLLGDAAHLMPPYAGEGVNMAMLDALELSNCLTGTDFPDIKEAIAYYENQMRARASETAKMTLEQTEALHSENAISHMLELFTE
ncbi:FAD-dependent oxidoreductase [Flavobacterium microcysteis]|uniref:Flavin-dependent monooxygenase n=1 Tax=Flavobacterium microcysteis TaxID=2596891 RepID=A0A501Q4U3_9FLAO|nr:NAD(P)/FAD-dependent oxidoreductase [Flavobacterium microcysteis]TPD66941.1 FAD-dependent monooxygenase [Flavobacterium microcysteis]